MRKIVRDAWKEEVSVAMSAHLPIFHLESKRSPGEWPHVMKFVHARSPRLLWAIAFRPLDEQFDAYVGWGTNGKSPFEGLEQIATDDLLWQFERDALMLPTATVAHRSGATYWSFWNPSDTLTNDPTRFAAAFAQFCTKRLTSEEARGLVRGPILEAISEIETFCLPYLDRVSEHFGVR